MDTIADKLNYFSKNNTKIDVTTSKISLGKVFEERKGSYLNEFNLFLAYFNAIPNFIQEIRIDCKKANKWFIDEFNSEITDCYFNKLYFDNKSQLEYDDIFYFLYEDLIVDFDTNQSKVRFLFRKTEISKVESIILQIKKFRKRRSRQKPEISLLINTSYGIDTKKMVISKPRLNINDNYNDDFDEIHNIILTRLKKNNDKGLIILHGKPGTGKTSYIRYLISNIKKDVIFLPPNMAAQITNPELINIMINNPNSVFVIEDAENIVIDREKSGTSPVSTLLNVSDGILADCLNIQIICSFNTDISTVDKALLRKGRLIAKYKFEELEATKAIELSKKLGHKNITITNPVTLSEIYNPSDKDFQKKKVKSSIGFNV